MLGSDPGTAIAVESDAAVRRRTLRRRVARILLAVACAGALFQDMRSCVKVDNKGYCFGHLTLGYVTEFGSAYCYASWATAPRPAGKVKSDVDIFDMCGFAPGLSHFFGGETWSSPDELGCDAYFPIATLWLVSGALLIVSLIRHRRRWRSGPPSCLRCGYNLTGNTSGRCPECGTDVPLTAPRLEPENCPAATPARSDDGAA